MRQPRNTTERDPGATTAKSAKEDHGDCRQLEHGSAPQRKRRGRPQQSGRLRQDARDSKAATAAGHTRAGDRPRRASAADIRGGRGGGTLRTRRAAAGAGRSAASGALAAGRPRGRGALRPAGGAARGRPVAAECLSQAPVAGGNNAGRRGNPTPSLLVLLIPQMGPTSLRPPGAWRAPLGGCCTAAPSRGPPGRRPPARTGSGP